MILNMRSDEKNKEIANESRHAFLVLAHDDSLSFRTLLELLDDARNDIFIHMDSKNVSYDRKRIEEIVRSAGLFHINSKNIRWGGYSQIDAEIALLKYATKHGRYAYYHLLSGQDLPIKDNDYIHKFFDDNSGKEFVQFQSEKFSYDNRIRYYYFFQDMIGRNKKNPLWVLNKLFVKIQKVFRVYRNKGIAFQKGANWFSVTDDLARYVVKREPWIKRTFRFSYCCDEVFLQTLIINSDYKNRLMQKKFNDDTSSIARLIDWKRGKPYVFRDCDYKELMQSDCLFARKFDETVDKKIIERIKDSLEDKKNEK